MTSTVYVRNAHLLRTITSATSAAAVAAVSVFTSRNHWRAFTARAAHLLRTGSSLSGMAEKARKSGLSDRDVARLIEFIEANIDTNLSLEELAAEAGLSVFHFLRSFKAATGETPHCFVSARRIARCRELLTDPSRSLAQIAYDCGYSNQSHMTTQFGRAVGMTPGAYRAEVSG